MSILVNYPRLKVFDKNGVPASGFWVWSYEAGTSTLLATYSDRACTVPHTNPIVLNAYGEPAGGLDVYVKQATRLVVTAADGDPASPYYPIFDYIGEQTNLTIDRATADPGTTHNNYTASTSPVYASIDNGFLLMFTPDTDNVDTMTSQVFTGTGIDDGTFYGPYVGSTAGSVFTVEIDATGTPDTFKWKKDGGAWTTGVVIVGGNTEQSLIEGITIAFASNTGHTLADIWALTVETPVRFNFCALGSYLVYKNLNGTLTALSGGDLKQDIPVGLVWSTTAACWILINTADPVLSSLVPYRPRLIVTGAYNITEAIHGWELSCSGAFTVQLPKCADAPHTFYYIFTDGTGQIVVQADGAELIYAPGGGAAATTYTFYTGNRGAIQIATNGIDWHIVATSVASGLPTCQVFTAASSTWTKPAGCRKVIVDVLSGGGGGGGGQAAASGAGGGAGGRSIKTIDVIAIASETVTVGAAGAAGAASATGGTGGTSSFGAHCSVTGGVGGTCGGVGGLGGVGSSGDINTTGAPGNSGQQTDLISGEGGSSPYGGGGKSVVTDATGLAGTGYGSGGGGGVGNLKTGGAGTAGIVLVWEYY